MIFKLKTVDVWDTLLRRQCHPEFIKVAVAKHVFLRPDLSLSHRFKDHWPLYRERLRIEAQLADKAQGDGTDNEYVLDEVLAEWLGSTCGCRISDELVAAIADIELSLEKSWSYADPQIADLLATLPAERTLFLSDFYMPSERLSRVLKHHRLDSVVPEGVSSCDVLLNKRSGRLFGYLHELFGVDPASHVHIGDNPHADVAIPAAIGVRTVHYEPGEEHAKRLHRGRLFEDRDFLLKDIRADLSELASDTAKAGNQDECPAFKLGCRLSPLVAGFLLDVAEKSIMSKVATLWFAGNGGSLLASFWEALFPGRRLLGHQLPAGTILEGNDAQGGSGSELHVKTSDEGHFCKDNDTTGQHLRQMSRSDHEAGDRALVQLGADGAVESLAEQSGASAGLTGVYSFTAMTSPRVEVMGAYIQSLCRSNDRHAAGRKLSHEATAQARGLVKPAEAGAGDTAFSESFQKGLLKAAEYLAPRIQREVITPEELYELGYNAWCELAACYDFLPTPPSRPNAGLLSQLVEKGKAHLGKWCRLV